MTPAPDPGTGLAAALAAFPAPLVIAAAVAAVAAWVALHLLPRPATLAARLALAVLRLAAGIGGLAVVLAVAGRFVVFQTGWHLGWCVAVAAAAVEAAVALYGLERASLPRGVGHLLVALRGLALLLLSLVLLEPTLSWATRQPDDRVVALLLDDSASMDLADPQAALSERLDAAQLLRGAPLAGRWRADEAAAEARRVERRLRDELAWVARAAERPTDDQPAWLTSRRAAAAAALAAEEESLAGLVRALAAAADMPGLPPEAAVAARAATAACDRSRTAVADARGLAAAGSDDLVGLAGSLGAAGEALAEATAVLEPLQPSIDAALVATLPPEERAAVERVAATSRRGLAAAALAATEAGGPGLVAALRKRNVLRTYAFAAGSRGSSLEEWRDGATPAGGPPPADRDRTDLAAALAQLRADVPADRLAGVIVVSDGGHNAADAVAPLGQWLAARQVPASSIFLGTRTPAIDAAVASLAAPERLQQGDRLQVTAGLRLDGLAGREVEVVLTRGTEEVARRKIAVTDDRQRTSVELADVPPGTQLWEYALAVLPLEGERATDNNTRRFAVDVGDDPVRLLLVDDRPRWEYRYLRSLFAERDTAVRLQNVLLTPDAVEGSAPREPKPAAADRPAGEAEATALPATPADWSGFDVVILGDLAPGQLDSGAQEALRAFVERRGGTLVIIAGRNHMPMAFAGGPLEGLLPATRERDAPAGPLVDACRVTLTPEGERHMIMQLDAEPQASRSLWAQMPEVAVRYPVGEARPGAEVLAYAAPARGPDPAQLDAPGADPAAAEEQARRRAEFVRTHALVVTQQVGAGRVCLLGFDATWRLRYRTGDTLHHRFWGQLLRWATATKLPHGNAQVRLGIEHTVYAPDAAPRVRVSLRGPDRAPLETDAVSVQLRGGDGPLGERRLEPVAGEPGMYEAVFDPPGREGRFSVALVAAPGAPESLVQALAGVTAEFATIAPPSRERSELSADPALLESLAAQTGGVAVPAWEARRVLDRLGAASGEIVEENTYPLWYRWPVFTVAVTLLAGEWLVRKKAGLT